VAESRPKKEGARKINRGGVQGIDLVFQLQIEVFSDREGSDFAYDLFAKSSTTDSPVVNLGQSGFDDRIAKPNMLRCLWLEAQTSGNVPQPLSPDQSRTRHADELDVIAEMRTHLRKHGQQLPDSFKQIPI